MQCLVICVPEHLFSWQHFRKKQFQKERKQKNKLLLITSVRWHVLIKNSPLIDQSNEHAQRLGTSSFSFLSHIGHKAPQGTNVFSCNEKKCCGPISITPLRTTGNSSVHCFTNCQNIPQCKINEQHRKSSSKKKSLMCL